MPAPGEHPRWAESARAAPTAARVGLRHGRRRGAAGPDRTGTSSRRCHLHQHHARVDIDQLRMWRGPGRPEVHDERRTGWHLEDPAVTSSVGIRAEVRGQALPQFAAYLDAIGAQSITVEAAAWTRLSVGVQPVTLSTGWGGAGSPATWPPPSTRRPKSHRAACSANSSGAHLHLFARGDRATTGGCWPTAPAIASSELRGVVRTACGQRHVGR